MSGRWTLRLVACAVGAAVALTGCSAEQEASRTLPEVSSAAPSEEALPPLGPEDMPMPAEARTQDAAGAEAFVRYYIDLINRTSTVMDAQPLRDFSDGCRECSRLAENVEADAAAGNSYEAGEITVTDVMPPVMEDGRADIPMVVNQAALAVKDSRGLVVDGGSQPYTDVPLGVAMTWDAATRSWLIQDMTFG